MQGNTQTGVCLPYILHFNLSVVLGTNARSEDIQAALREQASQERSTGRIEGRCCLTQRRMDHFTSLIEFFF